MGARVSLVIASKLNLSYGPKVLLEDASFSIGPTDRIGLVGANGTGKSTLLKILIGQIKPDSGTLTFRRNSRVGYLPQDLQSLPEGPLVQYVQSSVPGRDALHSRLAETEQSLGTATETEEQMELSQTLAELHEAIDHFEERFGRHRAERILLGLGFRASDMEKETSAFSGGWRMRAALAGLLLQDPDLLLLDEPTNHLDLPTLTWFDSFLKNSRKSVVLISHDRAFLNRQIGRVVSLEMEGLRTWTGNFDDYQRLRADESERLLAQAERQAAKRAQLQAFVDKFRAKQSKASQAQSKLKQIERMETIEVHTERATVGFRFPEVAPSGRDVATFTNITKSFGNNLVYDHLNAHLMRQQRVAVVGLNGAGKTTLLKILAGELEADAGEVKLGHNVTLGYYAQHHADTLNKERTILQEIMSLVGDKPQSYVRSVLGQFLFSGDDVDKPIGVLSGGERARVALARLLVKPANTLVMDEPTNHLDLDSSEALIEALEQYSGTLIFVSHNRSFLDALATHVWDVRDKTVVPYPGNLAEYLVHLEQAVQQKDAANSDGVGKQASGKGSEKERKRQEAEARQALSQKTTPLKKEIAALEKKIEQLEKDQREREQQLVDPDFAADFARARPVLDAHRLAADELSACLARWEQASAELEALTG